MDGGAEKVQVGIARSILLLLVEGFATVPEIGADLELTSVTANTHVHNLKAKGFVRSTGRFVGRSPLWEITDEGRRSLDRSVKGGRPARAGLLVSVVGADRG